MEAVEKEFVALKRARIFFVFFFFFGNGFKREPVYIYIYIYTLTHTHTLYHTIYYIGYNSCVWMGWKPSIMKEGGVLLACNSPAFSSLIQTLAPTWTSFENGP